MHSVSEIMQTRRSTRGFLPTPVPLEIIQEVVATARLAPSNSNTQPWHFAVVSGDALQQLSATILGMTAEGIKPNPAHLSGGFGLEGVYKERQYACAYTYYGSMGVAREDKAARHQLLLKNWEFFGAPHAGFLSMPATMHLANAVDLGIFLQSLMLLFAERGIGTIPQGALAAYPDPVKEIAEIPEENAIICGLSFGYPNPEAQINQLKQDRVAVEEMFSHTQ